MSTAGCEHGTLQDYRRWFFDRIGQPQGGNADNWEAVLVAANFYREHVQPNVIPDLSIDFGVRLQWRSDLTAPPAPRLWLPATGHAYGRYLQVIEDDPARPGGFKWAWFEAPGNEASEADVIHAPCDGGTTDPPEPPDPDDPVDNMAILLALAAIADRLSRIEEDLRTPVVMVGGVEVANLVFPITLTEQQP